MEQIIKQILGDLLFQNAAMQSQLQDAHKKIEAQEKELAELRPKEPG